jgi:hypothetical protein
MSATKPWRQRIIFLFLTAREGSWLPLMEALLYVNRAWLRGLPVMAVPRSGRQRLLRIS